MGCGQWIRERKRQIAVDELVRKKAKLMSYSKMRKL